LSEAAGLFASGTIQAIATLTARPYTCAPMSGVLDTTVSQSIPLWVARTLQHTLRGLEVKHGQVLESPRGARWDILVELADGTEVLAWVDREDQTPLGVESIFRQALRDAGISY
jgi:hypothetical protein